MMMMMNTFSEICLRKYTLLAAHPSSLPFCSLYPGTPDKHKIHYVRLYSMVLGRLVSPLLWLVVPTQPNPSATGWGKGKRVPTKAANCCLVPGIYLSCFVRLIAVDVATVPFLPLPLLLLLLFSIQSLRVLLQSALLIWLVLCATSSPPLHHNLYLAAEPDATPKEEEKKERTKLK